MRTLDGAEAAAIADLRAGSEEAYSRLVSQFHGPVYSLVYRVLNDPSDAEDTTQEVFLKVFRGIHRFNGNSSLKTWIYRIAIHEASNQRRWWFRHKRRETSLETPLEAGQAGTEELHLGDTLKDEHKSPFEECMTEEVRGRVESELRQIQEPYRTTVVLRDLEGLSYEEIAEVLAVSLGTVKSRLMRGREHLRKRLEQYARESGMEAEKRTKRTGPSHNAVKLEVETGR